MSTRQAACICLNTALLDRWIKPLAEQRRLRRMSVAGLGEPLEICSPTRRERKRTEKNSGARTHCPATHREITKEEQQSRDGDCRV